MGNKYHLQAFLDKILSATPFTRCKYFFGIFDFLKKLIDIFDTPSLFNFNSIFAFSTISSCFLSFKSSNVLKLSNSSSLLIFLCYLSSFLYVFLTLFLLLLKCNCLIFSKKNFFIVIILNSYCSNSNSLIFSCYSFLNLLFISISFNLLVLYISTNITFIVIKLVIKPLYTVDC